MCETDSSRPTVYDIASWTIAAVMLLLVLKLHLLPAFLAGFLLYEIVHALVPAFRVSRLSHENTKVLVVALLAIITVALLSLLIWGIAAFLRSDAGSLPALLAKMADILHKSQDVLPPWIAEYLPGDAAELKKAAVDWLNGHAQDLPVAGKEVGRSFALILIGMVIGAMVSLKEAKPLQDCRPFVCALRERVTRLHKSFRQIVFAQVRIAAINAVFTWLYLGVVLPLAGISLPFTKTIIVITFLVGLLPVIGNLISNTIIVIISLSQSLLLAGSSLVFLIVIHKLEYFLNARIMGAQIKAAAWELLVAMLIMEAAFGLPGVIAAPIYYAYMKSELADRGLI
jgi:predicted PurR-regulated permease PerM